MSVALRSAIALVGACLVLGQQESSSVEDVYPIGTRVERNEEKLGRQFYNPRTPGSAATNVSSVFSDLTKIVAPELHFNFSLRQVRLSDCIFTMILCGLYEYRSRKRRIFKTSKILCVFRIVPNPTISDSTSRTNTATINSDKRQVMPTVP